MLDEEVLLLDVMCTAPWSRRKLLPSLVWEWTKVGISQDKV